VVILNPLEENLAPIEQQIEMLRDATFIKMTSEELSELSEYSVCCSLASPQNPARNAQPTPREQWLHPPEQVWIRPIIADDRKTTQLFA